jgi:putative DNA primase/helicase
VPFTNKFGVTSYEPVIRDRAGYWEDKDEKRIYLFTAGGLREATKQFDHTRVVRALDTANAFFDKGGTERAKSCRVPDGRSLKLYHIDSSKLRP